MSIPVDYTSKAQSDLLSIRDNVKRESGSAKLAKDVVQGLDDAAQALGDSGPPPKHRLGEELDGYDEDPAEPREVRKNIVFAGPAATSSATKYCRRSVRLLRALLFCAYGTPDKTAKTTSSGGARYFTLLTRNVKSIPLRLRTRPNGLPIGHEQA